MKLTAVFEPAKEGGYTCFVEEIPAAISQGETIEEAKANLLDALKLVLECQRELAAWRSRHLVQKRAVWARLFRCGRFLTANDLSQAAQRTVYGLRVRKLFSYVGV